MSFKKTIAAYATISLVIALVIAVPAGITVIDEGERGVKTRLGNVVGDGLTPGLHYAIPLIEQIHSYSVRTETYTMSDTASTKKVEQRIDTDDAIDALTEKGLNIEIDMSVRYRLNGDNVTSVYTTIGQERELVRKVVRPTIRSEVRSSTADYSVEEIYSHKRDALAETIRQKIQDDFSQYGLVVERVQLRNIMLPQKVRDSIQEKEQALQNIEKTERQVEVEKLKAEKRRVEAKGIRDAQSIIQETLTQEYLQYLFITEGIEKGDTIYLPMGQNGLEIYKDVDKTGN